MKRKGLSPFRNKKTNNEKTHDRIQIEEAEKNDSLDEVGYLQEREQKFTADDGLALLMLVFLLIIVYMISILFIIAYDPVYYSISYVLKYIGQNISDFFNWILGNGVHDVINMKVRKYLIVTLVGMTLAAAGVMYKSIFRNVLAAPTTMGVQEGGILGNMLYIYFFGGSAAVSTSKLLESISESNMMSVHGQDLCIFIGCFLGVALVFFIGTGAGRHTLSTASLILTGTIVNGAIAGITGAIQYYVTMNTGDDDLVKILLNVTMGTFEYSYMKSQLIIMSVTLIPCIFLGFLFRNQMNVFSLGDEEASALGLKVPLFKWFIIILGAFMTSITMVYCGHIAFIGFIVPQISAKMVGYDFRKLYPVTILMGGIVMLIVYDFAVFTGLRDGLSMITSMIGGCMLIYTLMKKRGEIHGTFA